MRDLLDLALYELFRYHLTPRFALEVVAAALIAAAYMALATVRPTAVQRLHQLFKQIAERRTICIVACAILPVAIRLAALPWSPVPYPKIHDEFVHILVADTLLEGRLANPPHPLKEHLETIYVLQEPTYSAIYPLGQGMSLAIGKLLTGHYWGGVLLAIALMCGGVAWVLYQLLPPHWACIGGLLGSMFFGVGTYWTESYFGGAFLAFAGAVAFGALLRINDQFRLVHAMLLVSALTLCFLIRPYESAWFSLFLVGYVGIQHGLPKTIGMRLLPIGATFGIAAVLTVALTAVHNQQVTGSWYTLPYNLSQQVTGVPPGMIFQKVSPPPSFATERIRDVYEWQHNSRHEALENPLRAAVHRAYVFWQHYIQVWLAPPLLVGVLAFAAPLNRVAIAAVLAVMLSNVLYFFFFPHYIAMCLAPIVLLAVLGLRRIAKLSFRNKAIGHAFSLFLILGILSSGFRPLPLSALYGTQPKVRSPAGRQQIEDKVRAVPGNHVILVDYITDHSFHDEWVYNKADIDNSRVIWANYQSPFHTRQLFEYYPGRVFWHCKVSKDPSKLRQLSSEEILAHPSDGGTHSQGSFK